MSVKQVMSIRGDESPGYYIESGRTASDQVLGSVDMAASRGQLGVPRQSYKNEDEGKEL
jgi:hypothetical protein